MSPSDALLAFIKAWEGCRLVAYDDGVGVMTIGYGHTENVRPGDTCTQEQADSWLVDDVSERWHGIDPFIRQTLAQHEMDAIVSLCFNLKNGVQQIAGSTLLSRLNNGDFESAANEFLRWNRPLSMRGIAKRRKAERAMFLNADYSGRP